MGDNTMKYITIETKEITRNGNIWQTWNTSKTGGVNFIPTDTRDVYQMLKDISFGEVHNLKTSIEDLRFTFVIKFFPDGYDYDEREYIDITEQVMPLLVEKLTDIFGPMQWRNKTKYARGPEYKKMTQKAIDEIERLAKIKVE